VSGGEWLIRQRGPQTVRQGVNVEPFVTDRVTVDDASTAGGIEPLWETSEVGIHFAYPDGRTIIYPWANIVRAEYRPHPEP
jgi:hypothetical protein